MPDRGIIGPRSIAAKGEDQRGYAFLDLDRDGSPELIAEDAGSVVAHSYRPGTSGSPFLPAATGLAPCDLRFGSFADVDGDRYQDLVVRPHGLLNGCPVVAETRWIRNAGGAPWLDSASSETLSVPLETAPPPEWTQLIAGGGVCANGVEPPQAFERNWNDAGYVAEQARYTDLNGDGVADLAYALYACWQEQPDGDWHPVAGSHFSRIYWGDGYGEFIDSRLSAGPPLLIHTRFRPISTSGRHRLSGAAAPGDHHRAHLRRPRPPAAADDEPDRRRGELPLAG